MILWVELLQRLGVSPVGRASRIDATLTTRIAYSSPKGSTDRYIYILALSGAFMAPYIQIQGYSRLQPFMENNERVSCTAFSRPPFSSRLTITVILHRPISANSAGPHMVQLLKWSKECFNSPAKEKTVQIADEDEIARLC